MKPGSLDLSKTQWTSWKNVKVGKAGVKQLKIIAKNMSGKPGWCWPSFKNFKVSGGSVVPASAITVSGYMSKGAEGSYHQAQGTHYKASFVFKSPIDLYSFDAVGLYAKTYSQNGACNAITLAAYSTSGAQIWSSGSLDLSKTKWTSTWKNVKVGKAGVKQLKIIAKNTSGKPGWCWPSFKNFKVGSGGSGGAAFSASQVINGKTVKCASVSTTSTYTECKTLTVDGKKGFRNGVTCGPTWKTTNPTGSDLIGFCKQITGKSAGHKFYYQCESSKPRVTWKAGKWGTANDNGYLATISCKM